ncbi:unnamed protein product, partial [Oppiella nova]
MATVVDEQVMVEVVVPEIEVNTSGIDHSYCVSDNEEYKQLLHKYNVLRYDFLECQSLLDSIEDKLMAFINECICDSIIKTVQKEDIFKLLDKLHAIKRKGTHEDIHPIGGHTVDTNRKTCDTNECKAEDTNEDSVESCGQTSPLMVLNAKQTLVPIIGDQTTRLVIIGSNESTTATASTDAKSVTTGRVLDQYLNNVNYSYDYMPGVPKQFPCRECGRVFASGKQRNNHQRTHQKREQHYIHCQHLYCKKRFISPDAFKKHMDKHLGIESTDSGSGGAQAGTPGTPGPQEESYFKRKNKNKEYQCEWHDCDQWFALPSLRKQHYNAVHLKIARHNCMIPGCSAQFVKKYDLEVHIGVDHGFKFYKCSWSGCSRQFWSRTLLARHHALMHLKIKKFKCDECDQCFSNGAKLAAHKCREHNALKRFACDWSDCHFSTNVNKCLVEHKRTHTGERPHQCLWP